MPGDTPSEQTQIGWQRQALDVLSRLLDLADDSGLPAITWTVHAIDRGPGLTGHSPGATRSNLRSARGTRPSPRSPGQSTRTTGARAVSARSTTGARSWA